MKNFRKILSRSPYSRTVSLTLGQKLKFVLNFSPIAIAAAECLEAIASPRTGSVPREGIGLLLHRGSSGKGTPRLPPPPQWRDRSGQILP
ncbi:hypothetical protein [Phormidium sp. CCY1219]|uniref:hypothetical protein n=1 Tax=Phormidium sp. CCY1219 TaxID=2886104 RepID=UPI002D1F23A9|nr:hypothetical protein [Phormidium sp. CCY1219]MEB3830209.1 hypothetical protein [Phormidium sp. CCY1219]